MKLFCLLISLFSCLCLSVASQATPGTLDKIAAIVNEDIITQNQLAKRIKIIKRQMKTSDTPIPSDDILSQQVLEHMINERIQLQLAKNIALTIDDQALDEAIKNIAQQNEMTTEQMRESLQEENYTYEQFRQDLRNEMILSRLQQQQVSSNISVSANEIDSLIQQQSHAKNEVEYHLGHILISLPEDPSSEDVEKAYQHAQQIMQALNTGHDFQQMATEQSKGSQALKGGDLGWRKAGEVPTLFAESVSKMNKGDLVGPIRNSAGFHIITLFDKKEDDKQQKQAMREQARRMIQHRKYQEQYQAWLMQLRNESHIEIRS